MLVFFVVKVKTKWLWLKEFERSGLNGSLGLTNRLGLKRLIRFLIRVRKKRLGLV